MANSSERIASLKNQIKEIENENEKLYQNLYDLMVALYLYDESEENLYEAELSSKLRMLRADKEGVLKLRLTMVEKYNKTLKKTVANLAHHCKDFLKFDENGNPVIPC